MRMSPMLPAGGLDDVEEDQQRDRERGLAAGERDDGRGDAGDQHRDGQEDPEKRGVRSDGREHPGPDRESDDRADDASHDELARVQGVRTKHGQRPEDDPERVLHAAQVRHEGGQPQGDRAAHAVVQPHRVSFEVRRSALPCGRQRSADALGLVTEQAVPPAPPFGERGQLDVLRDLRDREAQLLRAEARIERSQELADLAIVRALRGPGGG